MCEQRAWQDIDGLTLIEYGVERQRLLLSKTIRNSSRSRMAGTVPCVLPRCRFGRRPTLEYIGFVSSAIC